jgi:alkaline phosphatase D
MASRFGDRLDVADFVTVNRRTMLAGLGASTLLAASDSVVSRQAWGNPVFSAYPFSMGVASGEPSPDGFVIWTKIAPHPLQRGGGMPRKPVEVEWSVASDARMRQVVQKGVATAYAELGHAVHVEIAGLDPARDYFYGFTVGGERSRIGRTRTLPPTGSSVAQLRFASAGCQRYDDGFFTAWKHIAEERFDFIYFYGDYIYEYRVVLPGQRERPVARVMPGAPDETFTLDDYRNRYAIYKIDPDLQAAHASAPFVMAYDDHEVANNWAGDAPAEVVPPQLFLLRRAAALQAWYEHVPVRRSLLPHGPDVLAYRRFAVGDLMTVNVLDTRLYRSDQACGDGVRIGCKEALDPARTMLGERQERWLYEGFKGAGARWNVLAQQVMMMRNNRNPDPKVTALNMDKWDGAPAARDRLFKAMQESKLANAVVLTGDIHNNYAGELKKDFAEETSPTLGVEFVATSVTSGGDGFDTNDTYKKLLARDPHVKFFNGQRGYVRHIVTPERWRADYQVLDKVSVAGGALSTRKSFVVENGKRGLLEAS